MFYYRVKPEFDNFRKNRNGDIFIGNELYTNSEINNIKRSYKAYYRHTINIDRIFEIVEIPKNKTHWFFGARFED